MRSDGSKAPVLMLTARDEEMDKVIGLEMGADDYVAKSISGCGSCRAVSRLCCGAPTATLPTPWAAASSGELVIDLDRRASSGATSASA